ncbi:hypothetical protein M404DRAFT_616042 [Pisolithus tinctorius Marx 270]|uniref:Uncharacterized protein n=1 Tax=Pisolithus tinctorius Marx 270 TaxID=870435 RepID=A0A0C3P8B1_PISTI|nr:hypothetical protein M404DRAFT_616042 [Pisolithus tinctorius Marx 270]
MILNISFKLRWLWRVTAFDDQNSTNSFESHQNFSETPPSCEHCDQVTTNLIRQCCGTHVVLPYSTDLVIAIAVQMASQVQEGRCIIEKTRVRNKGE